MRIFVKQLKKNYNFNFPVDFDLIKDEEGITAKWKEPLEVIGELTVIDKESAELEFRIVGEVEYPCSRCLEPVTSNIDYYFEEVINGIEKGHVDIDEYVVDCLYINEPFHILCDPFCKGLCPECGVNLNFETCNCQEKEEEFIDPRLEKLKSLEF